MGNVGPLEVVVVAIIALVVFGPKRVPELGRSLGQAMRGFRESLAGEDEDREEPPAQLSAPAASTGPAGEATTSEDSSDARSAPTPKTPRSPSSGSNPAGAAGPG